MRDLTDVPSSAFIMRLPIKHRGTSAGHRGPRGRVHLERCGVPFLPYTEEQLAARLSIFPGCWICGGPKECTDHVKAIGIGGWDALSNIRPACKSCNASKASRWGANLAAWLVKRRELCGVPANRGLFR